MAEHGLAKLLGCTEAVNFKYAEIIFHISIYEWLAGFGFTGVVGDWGVGYWVRVRGWGSQEWVGVGYIGVRSKGKEMGLIYQF